MFYNAMTVLICRIHDLQQTFRELNRQPSLALYVYECGMHMYTYLSVCCVTCVTCVWKRNVEVKSLLQLLPPSMVSHFN